MGNICYSRKIVFYVADVTQDMAAFYNDSEEI